MDAKSPMHVFSDGRVKVQSSVHVTSDALGGLLPNATYVAWFVHMR